MWLVDGCGDKRGGGGGGGGGRGIYSLDAVRCSTGRRETSCCRGRGGVCTVARRCEMTAWRPSSVAEVRRTIFLIWVGLEGGGGGGGGGMLGGFDGKEEKNEIK